MTNVADLADALEVKVLAVNAYAFSNEVVGDGEKVKTLCETADLMKEAAARLRKLEADNAQMFQGISAAVKHSRPYKDESGVVEVSLHPFGGLMQIVNERDANNNA